MKIALVTTLTKLSENKRIQKEAEKMGHELKIIDVSNFGFEIKDKKLEVFVVSEISNADLVIIRGIFNSLKPISTYFKAQKSRNYKIFDNNLFNSFYSIDKVTDLMKLSLSEVSVPNTLYSRNFNDFAMHAKHLGYPVIVKSTRTGKGVSVHKLESEEELNVLVSELETSGKNAKSYLIQEFIPYVHDLRVLMIGHDSFAMKRIPAKGEFRANFSLGGSVEKFDLEEKDRLLAIDALNAVGLQVAGVDILISKDGNRYILEVNHTAGMLGMEEATKENITQKYLEFAIKNAR